VQLRRPDRRGSARAVVPALIFVVGVAAGAAGLHYGQQYLPRQEPPASTALSTPVATTSVPAKGRLEPAGGIVSVYGPPGDRVLRMNAEAGKTVSKNETLFVLESRADREAEVALADRQHAEAIRLRGAVQKAGDAKLAEIDAEITQATAGKEADLAALDRQIKVREQQVELTKAQWKRISGLSLSPPSEQQRQEHELTRAQQEGELFVARKQRARREADYEHGLKVARAKRQTAELDIKQALERIPVGSLAQSLALAQRRLDATSVKSPITGQVLRILTRPGDTILGPQAVLQLANLDEMELVAEVNVDQIPELRRMLQEGTVVASATKARLLGPGVTGLLKEENIARAVGPSVFKPTLPGESRDRRVVEVRVPLDREASKTASEYVDLEVAVEFRLKGAP
jgi:HlyD family secretion protein